MSALSQGSVLEPHELRGGGVVMGDTTLNVPALRALDRYLASALHHLRTVPPMAALGSPQWAILVELICARVRGEEKVTQGEVVRLSGYCERLVRRLAAELEDARLIASSREAGRVVAYRLGEQLVAAISDFAWGLDAHIWTRGASWLRGGPQPQTPAPHSAGSRHTPAPDAGVSLRPAPRSAVDASTPAPRSAVDASTPAPRSAGSPHTPAPDAGVSLQPAPRSAGSLHTPARDAGVPARGRLTATASATPLGAAIASNLQRIRVSPDVASVAPAPEAGMAGPTSASLLIKNKNLRSSSSPERPTGPAKPTPAPGAAESQATPDARRAVAFRALTARYQRGFPDRSSPTSFAAADIDTVVAVTAGLDLSEPALDQLHADAIAGAWDKSKRKPPTVGFIWGNPEYFLQNAADGRAERETAARVAAADSARRAKQAEPQERVVSFAETHDFAKDIGQRLARIAEADPPRPKNVRFFPIPEPTTEPRENDHE